MALVAQLCPNIAQVLTLSQSIALSTFHKLGKKSNHMEMIFVEIVMVTAQIPGGKFLNSQKKKQLVRFHHQEIHQ